MGLFESHEEKKNDVRILERSKAIGKLDKKAFEAILKALPDDAANAITVNVDELNARDNPVHVPRGLPSLDVPARKNYEELEFDAEESNRNFEH